MIDLGKHVPGNVFLSLWRFCPRSGWLLAVAGRQALRVHGEGAGPVQCLADDRGRGIGDFFCGYEMDFSTRISNTKLF